MKNTKQYVWIFIFLFGVLLLSYSMYYFFWNGKKDIDNVKEIISGDKNLSKDNNTEKDIEDDKLTNISDKEVVDSLLANNNQGNTENVIFDEPMMGNTEVEDKTKLPIWDIEVSIWKWNNQIWSGWIAEDNDIDSMEDELEVIENTPIEGIPKEVIIWDYTWILMEDSELSEINNIYNILWYREKYPVYLFDTDITVSWLQGKMYDKEYPRIIDLIWKLGGTVVQLNMFGDKQFFINIPTYYKKKVVMGIERMGVFYLVILDYDIYQQKKEFIGNLFSK